MAPSLQAMLSRHALARMQQRGIGPGVIDSVLQYGREYHDRHGGVIVCLDKRGRRQMQRASGMRDVDIDALTGVYVVLTTDGTVITVGHRYRRMRHH